MKCRRKYNEPRPKGDDAIYQYGEPMCFVHVLLNALDMKKKGIDVKCTVQY